MKEHQTRRPIALLGSSRRHGNTGALLDIIATELEADVIDLSATKLSPYDYEHKNIDDDFVPLLNRILEHEDILFASPIYWYTMSSQMKIFFDRLSDLLDLEELKDHGRALRGKRAHVVATSISPVADASFSQAFENTFSYMGMELGSSIHVDCSLGFNRKSCAESIESFVSTFRQS